MTDLRTHFRASFLRLYDSRSAGAGKGGNFIPAQPADHVLMRKGVCWLIETKSSNKKDSLADCSLRSYISEEQIAGARLWIRSGGRSIFPFLSLSTNIFEIWEGLDVIKAYMEGHRLKVPPIVLCKKSELTMTLERLT